MPYSILCPEVNVQILVLNLHFSVLHTDLNNQGYAHTQSTYQRSLTCMRETYSHRVQKAARPQHVPQQTIRLVPEINKNKG